MKFGRFYNHILTTAFSASILFGSVSLCFAAEDIKALTKANITAFINNTTEITTGNSDNLPPEKIEEYLDKHLDKKARFKSVMKYHIPGMPIQEAALSFDKDGFIKSINEGTSAVEDYENLIEIKEIKIASNGKKAFIKTLSTEYADMAVPTETGDIEDVPMKGLSECTQIISLSNGVIQMYSANCVTNIEFLEY